MGIAGYKKYSVIGNVLQRNFSYLTTTPHDAHFKLLLSLKLNRCGYKYGPDLNNASRHLDLYK